MRRMDGDNFLEEHKSRCLNTVRIHSKHKIKIQLTLHSLVRRIQNAHTEFTNKRRKKHGRYVRDELCATTILNLVKERRMRRM